MVYRFLSISIPLTYPAACINCVHMKLLLNVLLMLPLALALMLPIAPLHANQQPQALELHPVMIIRFNQPSVDYHKQLSMVLNRARMLKPNVMFDIIQYIPDTASRSRLATYEQHKRQVLDAFIANGINPKHMHVAKTITPDVATDEVYIFVR